MTEKAFWRELENLTATHHIVIDRPKNHPHPKWPDLIYPFDYGYFEHTSSSDGGGIDVWIGSLPTKMLTGILCTFDKLKFDAEIKILLGCTSNDVQTIIDFNTDVQYLFIPNPEETHEDHS